MYKHYYTTLILTKFQFQVFWTNNLQQHFLFLWYVRYQTKINLKTLTNGHFYNLCPGCFANTWAQHGQLKLKILFQLKNGASAQAQGELPQIHDQWRNNFAQITWASSTCIQQGAKHQKSHVIQALHQHKNCWRQQQHEFLNFYQKFVKQVFGTNTFSTFKMRVATLVPI